jgi:hypothetical protein
LHEPDEPDWTSDKKQALPQMQMFETEPPEALQKIPFKFSTNLRIFDFSFDGWFSERKSTRNRYRIDHWCARL